MHSFFTLLLSSVLLSSAAKGISGDSPFPETFYADSSFRGATYTYDVAGNRISRKPNTIVISSTATVPGRHAVPEYIQDSVFGRALSASGLKAGIALKCSPELAVRNTGLYIKSPDKELLLYECDKLPECMHIDMSAYPKGRYALYISAKDGCTRWTIIKE